MAGERECSGGGGVVKRCPTGLANPTCTTKVEKFQNGSESECALGKGPFTNDVSREEEGGGAQILMQ